MSILLNGLLALQVVTAPLPPWPDCSNRVDSLSSPGGIALADTLARRFAPALSFAPGERYFPTLPFFAALDGDKALGDPDSADFADPIEVAPYLRDKDGAPFKDKNGHPIMAVAWQELLKAYHPEPGSRSVRGADHEAMEYALKRVVALYRVCSLTDEQNQTLKRFLRSDEQAWERFEAVRPLDSILTMEQDEKSGEYKEHAFDVIQYFLYYLRDWGLLGHPNDIELVSVFFPHREEDRGKLRIVVGSGHTSRTPNNVLVESAYHRGKTKLDDSSWVMVELGGHSSAPDVRPIGKFTPGLDANWHAYDVWGTRDAQAAGGVGYLGRYAQAMTFDRGLASDGTLVFPPSYDSTAMREVTEAVQGIGDTLKEKRQPKTHPAHHQYRLLPMHLLFRLDTALAVDTAKLDVELARHDVRDGVAAAVSAVQDELCPRLEGGPGCDGLDSITWDSKRFSTLDSATQTRAIKAMLRWKGDMIVDTTFNRFEPTNQALPGLPRVVEELSRTDREMRLAVTHRPWEHQSFMGKCKKGKKCEGKADPTEVFKAHLFRPNTYTVGLRGGLPSLILWGFSGAPTDGFEMYTGIVVPAFRSHGLPVRLGGYMELHVGVNCAWRCRAVSPTFGVLHEGHRNSIVSWYVTGSWVPRRPEVTADPDAGEFSIGGGASLLPFLSTNTFGVINVVRLRGGIRLDPFQGKDLFNRVRWELQLAFRQ